MENNMERVRFFEDALLTAEATYFKNPLDADNLTRWAGALWELSQYQIPYNSKLMLQDAISKVDEALLINPKKHDALWVLGSGHISYGFLLPDQTQARDHFEKATHFFQQALEDTELYIKALDMASKAPELHTEVFNYGLGPQPLGGPSSTGSKTMKKKNSHLKYDVLGWVILAAGIVTWIRFANSHMPVSKQ